MEMYRFCDDSISVSDFSSLTIDNVAGVFVVLLAGLVISLFVAVAEFLWKAKKEAKDGGPQVRVTY